MNKKRRDGATALLLSVQQNQLESTRHLLLHPQIRVNVRSLFPERVTPLILAIRLQRTEQLALLLQSPALTVEENMFERATPLEYARAIAVDDDGASEMVSVAIQRAIKLLKVFDEGGSNAVEDLVSAEGRGVGGSAGGVASELDFSNAVGNGYTKSAGGVRFSMGLGAAEEATSNRLLLRQPIPQAPSPLEMPSQLPPPPPPPLLPPASPSLSQSPPPNFDHELKLLSELAEMELSGDARLKLGELASALRKRAGISDDGDNEAAAADTAMKKAASSARARAKGLLKKKKTGV